MRVALVAFWFPEYCAEQASALAEHADVALCFPENLLGRARDLLLPRVELVPIPKHGRRSPANLLGGWELRSTLRRLKPDVIHAHANGHARLMLALPLLRRFPLVMTIHDPMPHPGESTWVRRLANAVGRRRANHFLLHGERQCQQFSEAWGIAPERMTSIAHGVLDYRRWHDPGLEPPVRGHALLFGRMRPYKGVGVLIEAAARLRSDPASMKIVIAGRGEGMDDHRRRVEALDLGDRVMILDQFIDEPLVDALHRHARVVVLPYTEATQSGPATTACAYGKPLIASRVGGLPDVVRDGQTGLLVPPSDPDALAEALDHVAGDDELVQRLGEGARRLAETELSWAALAPPTLEAYERAIAAHRRRWGG